MQKLSLTKRPGIIGGNITVRTQAHGEEKVGALSIPVAGMLLDKDELNVLLQDPGAWDALYTTDRGKHPEPRFLGIQPIQIHDKFKDAKVTITPDNTDEPIVMKPAIVGGITLEPQEGGLTATKCMLSGIPDRSVDCIATINRKCTVSILNGKLADRNEGQGELPLEGAAPTAEQMEDVEEDEEEDAESSLGRRMRVSAAKRGRAKKERS